MKRKNNYTGKGIHNLSETAIQQLYDGNFTYIKFEEKYLKRRFHAEEYLSELLLKQQHQLIRFGHDNIEQVLHEQSLRDIELQKRFETFSLIHNGRDKPLLVLDVDNTMLCARFFCDEMKIGDQLTYFSSFAVPRNNAKVLQLQQTLTLIITNNELIDLLGTETIKHSIWITNNDELKKYNRKNNELFFYEMTYPKQQELKIKIPCKVNKTQITGCKIQIDHTIEYIEQKMTKTNDIDDAYDIDDRPILEEIDIDFTRHNEHLSKLEPCLNRDGMLPIDFIYDGFLIRIRPNLDEFMELVFDKFDVVIMTAAKECVYKGLLETLHEYLKDQMGRENETDLRLWTDILYRKDCILRYDIMNKPYHHKDLTLFGCDLSRVVMIDNSPIVLHKQEPNSIFIKDFFGKDDNDDQLMGHIYPLLEEIHTIQGDIRYFLCSLDDKYQGTYCDSIDLSTEEQCKLITQTFVNLLKFNVNSIKQESDPFLKIEEEPEHNKRRTAPLAMMYGGNHRSLKKKHHGMFEKSKSMKDKPLHFQKLQSYERVSVYSSMAIKTDDNFDFDIGGEPDDIWNTMHPQTDSDGDDQKQQKEEQEESKNDREREYHSSIDTPEKVKFSILDGYGGGRSVDSDTSYASSLDAPKNVRFASVVGIKQYTVSEKSLDLYNHSSINSVSTSTSIYGTAGISEDEEVDWNYIDGTMLNVHNNQQKGSEIDFSVYDFCDVNSTDQEIIVTLVDLYQQMMIKKGYHQALCNKYQKDIKYQSFKEQDMDKSNALQYERKEYEKCEYETKKYLNVLKQWKQDVIKSYCYEQKPGLYTFDDQQQQFFFDEFNKLSSFILDIHFIDIIFKTFEKHLKQITGKKTKKITLYDICSTLNSNNNDHYLYDFNFVFKPLMNIMDSIIDNKSLKSLCDRTLNIVNTYYSGEYAIFCTNVMIQILHEMIEGNSTPNSFINDIVSAIILIISDKKKFLEKLYDIERSKDICERIVALIALNLPPFYDEYNVSKTDDETAINYVMKICYELNIKESVQHIIRYFYDYFWAVHHGLNYKKHKSNNIDINGMEQLFNVKIPTTQYTKVKNHTSSRSSRSSKSSKSSPRKNKKRRSRKTRANKARISVDITSLNTNHQLITNNNNNNNNQYNQQTIIDNNSTGYCGDNSFFGNLFGKLCNH